MSKEELKTRTVEMQNQHNTIEGICDNLLVTMGEWQKTDSKCRDSEAYKQLEAAIIKLREAQRELSASIVNVYKEINYGKL